MITKYSALGTCRTCILQSSNNNCIFSSFRCLGIQVDLCLIAIQRLHYWDIIASMEAPLSPTLPPPGKRQHPERQIDHNPSPAKKMSPVKEPSPDKKIDSESNIKMAREQPHSSPAKPQLPREPERTSSPSPSQQTRPDPVEVKRAIEEWRRVRTLPYEELCRQAEADFPGWGEWISLSLCSKE